MRRVVQPWSLFVASCGLMLAATSLFAQTIPATRPVPATRSGPGGSANPILPDPTAQSPASQRQTVVGAPQPGTAVQAAPLPTAVVTMAATAVDVDRQIATMLAIAHRNEAQLGSLARDRSLASQVKLLATEVTDDHNRALTDLNELHPGAVTPLETAQATIVMPARPAQPARPDATVPPTSTIQPALPTAAQPVVREVVVPDSTALSLQRRVADQCLTLAQRKLSEKQGAEFDAAYVVMTLTKQQELYAKLQAMRELASPELRRLIDAQMVLVQRHYGLAERLLPEVASRAYVVQTPGAVPR